MKVTKYLLIVLLTTMWAFTGCKLEEPGVKKSSAEQLNDATKQLFTKYVALGMSLTAGYESGALTEKHQKVSYVKQIATQAGVGNQFVQPLIAYPGLGAYTAQGAGIMELTGFDASGNPVINPVPYATTGFNPQDPYVSSDIKNYAAPYSNLGIPGIVLGDMDSAITAANSYSHNGLIDPILRNPAFGNTTPIEQALMLKPTFITCWIGGNDVLGYATSGGTYPPAPTDVNIFQALYTNLLNKLTSGAPNAKIIVANTPDVTSPAFFTAVPYMVDPGTGTPVALVIQTGSGAVRQATADDLILLTAKSIIGDVSGTYGPQGVPVGFDGSAPLPNSVVLDKDEKAVAQKAVDDYNAIISSVASQFNVPVVDANSLLKDIADADGYEVGGVTFTGAFLTGGFFSLDGVHPNDVGYAIVANLFIETINANFDTNIPPVNIMNMIGIQKQEVKMEKKTITANPDFYKSIPEIFGGKINL